MTEGVVRVGETVRRPRHPRSHFVAVLLAHLEAVGFRCAPRYLGRDEVDRDVFSYVDGWVPARFQRFEDSQVCEAAGLLRSLHVASSRGTSLARDVVVCHHDPGPNNFVFQGDTPIALIDFDFAALGDLLEDVAYMAWTWCVSSKPERRPARDQAAQVRTLAQAYGLRAAQRRLLSRHIVERQRHNIRFWQDRLTHPLHHPATVQERIRWSERELAYTLEHRSEFDSALR